MEFIQLFAGIMWVVLLGAHFTSSAKCQMRDDAARILAQVRVWVADRTVLRTYAMDAAM